MKLIACVNNNWGIGKNGSLLYHISDDLKRFKNLTYNNIVIMGRKTWEGIPNGYLEGRINIVISKTKQNFPDNVIVVEDINKLKQILKKINSNDDNTWVIGGETIYNLFIHYCNEAYITMVDDDSDADTFLPNLYEYDFQEVSNEPYKIANINNKNIRYSYKLFKR